MHPQQSRGANGNASPAELRARAELVESVRHRPPEALTAAVLGRLTVAEALEIARAQTPGASTEIVVSWVAEIATHRARRRLERHLVGWRGFIEAAAEHALRGARGFTTLDEVATIVVQAVALLDRDTRSMA